MPTYEHRADCCGYEWEDDYSIKKDPPTICPNCQVEGKVMRLISGGSGRGIVTLTGHELKASVKEDTNRIKARMKTDENYKASIVGEDNYHQSQLQSAKLNDLVKIGVDTKKTKGYFRRN